MGKAQYKIEGGKLIKVQLVKNDNSIGKVKITGDFFLHPEHLIEDLEKTLEGLQIENDVLAQHIADFIQTHGATLLGAAPEDFAKCIVMAGENDD